VCLHVPLRLIVFARSRYLSWNASLDLLAHTHAHTHTPAHTHTHTHTHTLTLTHVDSLPPTRVARAPGTAYRCAMHMETDSPPLPGSKDLHRRSFPPPQWYTSTRRRGQWWQYTQHSLTAVTHRFVEEDYLARRRCRCRNTAQRNCVTTHAQMQ
jgi:hypothetical protein